MRILYYDLFRGLNTTTASTHVKEVIQNLEKSGHEILLYDGELAICETTSAPNNRLNPYSGIAKRWPLLGIIFILLGEIRLFLKVNLALLRTCRYPDIVYYRNTIFNIGLWTAKLFRVPAIKEINGILTEEMQNMGEANGFALHILNSIEHWNMPKADMIVTVTSKLRDVLIKEYYVPQEKILVIENGANVDLFRPLNKHDVKIELGLDDKLRYVCFSGHFITWQGLEYLIKCIPLVLSECPNTCFLLVGDGELKNNLIQMANDLNVIDKIIFTGMVPYIKIPLYINASDVCVTPKIPLVSGYSPLKLCEYLACERPVVASNICGLEILKDYNMGLLVHPEDEISLGKAIITLLNNPDLRNIMGRNGRKYVVENRSWMKAAEKTLEIMDMLVNKNKSGVTNEGISA